jgi:shikimate kinase
VPVDHRRPRIAGAEEAACGAGERARWHAVDHRQEDCDDVLEERTGRTARQIADAEGIDHLHELEAQIALEMLSATTPAVIGPAASVIEVDAVRDALQGHVVVWLTGPIEELAESAASKDHRPLVHDHDPVELMEAQMAARQPLANAIADLVIDISVLSRDEQAAAVVDAVRARFGHAG